MHNRNSYDGYREKSDTTFAIGLLLWFAFCLTVAIGIQISAIMYQLNVSMTTVFSWSFLDRPIVVADVLWVALYTAILGAITKFVLKRFVMPIIVKLIF